MAPEVEKLEGISQWLRTPSQPLWRKILTVAPYQTLCKYTRSQISKPWSFKKRSKSLIWLNLWSCQTFTYFASRYIKCWPRVQHKITMTILASVCTINIHLGVVFDSWNLYLDTLLKDKFWAPVIKDSYIIGKVWNYIVFIMISDIKENLHEIEPHCRGFKVK